MCCFGALKPPVSVLAGQPQVLCFDGLSTLAFLFQATVQSFKLFAPNIHPQWKIGGTWLVVFSG
jgi:hypothetical protein